MKRAVSPALTLLFLGCAAAALASDTIPSAAAESPVTFAKDVAPILYNRCVGCHRAGEVAPMPLVTFEDARPWAKSIKRRVTAREMPPWGADPRFGTFKDDQSLTDAEIQTIARWVDAG